ncbi:hypothetical protein OE88DRAFT_1710971 [Heliocybe sulcata]|uniref:Uncharacterized protein n=1 Tax=Heliocybe sulcata TaxID=5364 RepID=A0A5C3NAG6_9AGAM|nr:hypothetical protein OE88DRAFT_1710971 [Heliocybe sulcata]
MYALPLLALPALASALFVPRVPVAYYDPNANGGSMLDSVGSSGLGEPLNIILSGLSSPAVLTDAGVLNYARAIGFSEECFGIHQGGPQTANLGDGNGYTDQLVELRQDYGSAGVGTCLESLVGGNHFRIWRQNGTEANSGALFFATSQEEDVTEHHTIVPDGYNIGRDLLAQAAVGTTSYGGVTYNTVANNVTGLLKPGVEGVNHNISTDGITTILTVTIQ